VQVGFTQASATRLSSEDAILAVALREAAMSVAPWVPCTTAPGTAVAHAAALDLGTARAQEAALGLQVQQIYTPNEPSHAGLVNALNHTLEGLADQAAQESATPQGASYSVCVKGGGADKAKVIAISFTGPDTASITIQCRLWNDTIGTNGGVPFEFDNEAVIQKTDNMVQSGDQWLVSNAGAQQFLSGMP